MAVVRAATRAMVENIVEVQDERVRSPYVTAIDVKQYRTAADESPASA
jgi:hypothetical protein